MKTPLIYIALLCLFAGGCRKEPLPEPANEEPVFYVSCNVDQVPVNLVAGDNDYEMVSGFHQDSNGVYVLSASMQKKNCSDCYGLTLLLNDHKLAGQNGALYIDSALHSGNYLFYDTPQAAPEYKINLMPEGKQDPTGNYTWIISQEGEADIVKKAFQCYVYARAKEVYTVTLRYEDASGCSASHTSVFQPGSVRPVSIDAANSGGDLTFSFTAAVQVQPVSYLWEFGDGETSSEPAPSHKFADLGGGHYTTTLTVTYADHRTARAVYQVPGTAGAVCLANFDSDQIVEEGAMGLSRITIELREPSGKVYSTREFAQPGNSSFEVVSVEDYRNNQDGQPTKRFKVKFNCIVKYEGEELQITDGEAVLAVAYK